MLLAATTAGSPGLTGVRGVLAEVIALRSAWQVGSDGVAVQAASFALMSPPRLARPASAASGGVVVYPGTTDVALGVLTMPRMTVFAALPAVTPWSCDDCANTETRVNRKAQIVTHTMMRLRLIRGLLSSSTGTRRPPG